MIIPSGTKQESGCKLRSRILIDTDMGGDVDDAIAIALALNSPEIEVAGISLVYIDNTWRFGIVKPMLDIFERSEIPVVKGAEKPLLGRWNDWQPAADNNAAEFIISLCEQDPGLVLVPIGPLTNIAAAFTAAPRIAKERKVLLMGGALNQARAEWNILCDPEAAAIVLESGADIRMVGLNATEQCQLTQEEVDSFANTGPKGKLLYEMMCKFIKDYNYLPILHDPLAMGTLLWDDIVIFEKKQMAIELSGAYSRGFLIETPHGAAVEIAVDVNADLFKRLLIERLCR